MYRDPRKVEEEVNKARYNVLGRPSWYLDEVEKYTRDSYREADELAERHFSWEDFGIDPNNPQEIFNAVNAPIQPGVSPIQYVWTSDGRRLAIPKDVYNETVGKTNERLAKANERLK